MRRRTCTNKFNCLRSKLLTNKKTNYQNPYSFIHYTLIQSRSVSERCECIKFNNNYDCDVRPVSKLLRNPDPRTLLLLRLQHSANRGQRLSCLEPVSARYLCTYTIQAIIIDCTNVEIILFDHLHKDDNKLIIREVSLHVVLHYAVKLAFTSNVS